jgi:hypothetical protein
MHVRLGVLLMLGFKWLFVKVGWDDVDDSAQQ